MLLVYEEIRAGGRTLRLGLYESEYNGVRPTAPVPSDALFSSDLARLADAVESLTHHGISLKGQQDGGQPETGDRLSLLTLRLRSSLQILDYVMNSDHVRKGCCLIAPATVTYVFREIHKVVGEVLEQDLNYQYLRSELSAREKRNRGEGFPFILREHSEHLLGPAQ